ncbi:MAG: hypothetical protein COY40_05600 [Alphaproteobacteria bacterium CG_4_10_14_0_8_um_filter_53_9]|nr:MAG: hypothetical protein COY40_05600 [Alphaproteobacteria bacterium CG_4_10_14_0_8_um_filter_53_9]
MASRGRKSLASLSTSVVELPESLAGRNTRLQPTATLGPAERAVWMDVVNDQPANSFTQAHSHIMEMYCRHVVHSRIISTQLASVTPASLKTMLGLERYEVLLKLHERETRSASALATRLRITRQSIDQKTIARTLRDKPSARNKPWETPNDED